METLTLADGTVIENAYAYESLGKLWFYIKGMDIREAFAMMSDPVKTATVVDGVSGQTFTGYTNIFSIQRDTNLVSGGIDKE